MLKDLPTSAYTSFSISASRVLSMSFILVKKGRSSKMPFHSISASTATSGISSSTNSRSAPVLAMPFSNKGLRRKVTSASAAA